MSLEATPEHTRVRENGSRYIMPSALSLFTGFVLCPKQQVLDSSQHALPVLVRTGLRHHEHPCERVLQCYYGAEQ